MKVGNIERVAMVGAGRMGHGIALEYALGGEEVRLLTSRPETAQRAREAVREELELLAGEGLITTADAQMAAARVHPSVNMEEAVRDADLVVESVSEDLELKLRLFHEIDQLAPAHALIASNTSALSITTLGAATRRPEQVVGTHYWNPPHMMPLVEVTSGENTAADTVETVCALLRRLGKTPIHVNKDVPGFVWNRLQHALFREAMWLLSNGVVTPEELDLVGKLGLGRRLFTAGFCEAADLGGIDVWTTVQSYMLEHISSSIEVSPLLTEMVARGDLGSKTGRGFYEWPAERLQQVRKARDKQLIAWLKVDKDARRGW
jgi:3-hydroxybutyryl-CoA dehydrogenase